MLRQAQPLDALLAQFISRGINSVAVLLLDVLRIGAYQLRFLDRVPPHAAVATTVALARESVNNRAAGFANAVLRRVSGMPRPAAGDAAPAGARLAVPLQGAASHPDWLVARWRTRFGDDATNALLQWNNTQPSLVLQSTRGTTGELESMLRAQGIAATPAPHGAGVIVTESRPERLPGYDDGAFFVQDTAQALVVHFAAFPADAIVYDACTAPGGKLLGLSRRTRHVIAADRSRVRLRRVTENVARAGRGTEHLIVADASHPPVRPVLAYLLDAPCLGTGSFARHPDARLRVTMAALEQLAAAQGVLLDAAAERIALGGLLCYATCSLEPEENETQVNAFLRRHPDFRRLPPAGFPAELLTQDGDLLTLPQRDRIDGAFAARLVRAS